MNTFLQPMMIGGRSFVTTLAAVGAVSPDDPPPFSFPDVSGSISAAQQTNLVPTKTIQLSAVPAQSLSVVLGGRNYQLTVRQRSTGVFIDIAVLNKPLVSSVICTNRTRLIRHAYTGFVGNLAFVDLQGDADPDYTGLGSRFVLVYLEAGK